jgi:uroporphyrinogen-III decarboxylase
LTDFYLTVIDRAAGELHADGVFTNDDLGAQTTPLFGPDLFSEFLLPYYRELFTRAHEQGMHFWLHSCGCIQPFLQGFIEAGLDVIHPIQKYAMNQEKVRDTIVDKICIWTGLDVQRVIPCGSPDEVRREVRYLMDTWYRPTGRLLFASGNMINRDCPLENLYALYDEAYRYGSRIAGMHTRW